MPHDVRGGVNMIQAFKRGKTTQEIAALFALPLEEVVNTIYSRQREWTLDAVARFANTSETQVSEALQEAYSILDRGNEYHLKRYAEGYQRTRSNERTREYIVETEIEKLGWEYVMQKVNERRNMPFSLDDYSLSLEVARRKLELLLFMHENRCSFAQIHVALGICEKNAQKLIEKVRKIEEAIEGAFESKKNSP